MRLAITLVAAATLLGCSTTPKYSCGAPLNSGGCRSVSHIHAVAIRQPEPSAASDTTTAPSAGLGSPVMSAPRTLRIQVCPYQDGDGDLHGASYVYTLIGSGEWTFTSSPGSLPVSKR